MFGELGVGGDSPYVTFDEFCHHLKKYRKVKKDKGAAGGAEGEEKKGGGEGDGEGAGGEGEKKGDAGEGATSSQGADRHNARQAAFDSWVKQKRREKAEAAKLEALAKKVQTEKRAMARKGSKYTNCTESK